MPSSGQLLALVQTRLQSPAQTSSSCTIFQNHCESSNDALDRSKTPGVGAKPRFVKNLAKTVERCTNGSPFSVERPRIFHVNSSAEGGIGTVSSRGTRADEAIVVACYIVTAVQQVVIPYTSGAQVSTSRVVVRELRSFYRVCQRGLSVLSMSETVGCSAQGLFISCESVSRRAHARRCRP